MLRTILFGTAICAMALSLGCSGAADAVDGSNADVKDGKALEVADVVATPYYIEAVSTQGPHRAWVSIEFEALKLKAKSDFKSSTPKVRLYRLDDGQNSVTDLDSDDDGVATGNVTDVDGDVDDFTVKVSRGKHDDAGADIELRVKNGKLTFHASDVKTSGAGDETDLFYTDLNDDKIDLSDFETVLYSEEAFNTAKCDIAVKRKDALDEFEKAWGNEELTKEREVRSFDDESKDDHEGIGVLYRDGDGEVTFYVSQSSIIGRDHDKLVYQGVIKGKKAEELTRLLAGKDDSYSASGAWGDDDGEGGQGENANKMTLACGKDHGDTICVAKIIGLQTPKSI